MQTDLQSHSIVAGLWQLGVGFCRGMCDGCGVLLLVLVALYSLHMHSCCLQTKSVQRRLHGSSGSSSLSWKHCRGALQLFYLDLGH